MNCNCISGKNKDEEIHKEDIKKGYIISYQNVVD